MKTKDRYYVGTDLKFLLKIESPGFSQDDDDYEVTLISGGKSVTIPKSDIVDGADGHYLLVDSTQLEAGLVKMVVTAKVTDEDFEKGYRREVEVKDLCYIKKVF